MTARGQEWIIRISLDVVDGVEADEWYSYIERAIMLRDSGFSGLLSMTLDPISDEGPIIQTPEEVADMEAAIRDMERDAD